MLYNIVYNMEHSTSFKLKLTYPTLTLKKKKN